MTEIHGMDVSNVHDLDVKELTLRIMGSNLSRRESMIAPAFKGKNIPDDPRTMRLQNELLSAQSTEALTLLGLYEQGKSNDNLETVRDMIADVIRDANSEPRAPGELPIVDEKLLPMDAVTTIIEDREVNLRDYLKEDG